MGILAWLCSSYFLTVLAEWSACMLYISFLPQRWDRPRKALLSMGMFFVQAFVVGATTFFKFQNKTEMLEPFEFVFLRVFLYMILMALFLYAACAVTFQTAFYMSINALLAAELAWSLTIYAHMILYHVSVGRGGGHKDFSLLLTSIPVFALVFGILLLVEKLFSLQRGSYKAGKQDILIASIITLFSFVMANNTIVFRGRQEPSLWGAITNGIPHWVFILIGLILLYEYRMYIRFQRANHEVGMIRNTLENMTHQYEQARVNEEIIHQRYHDLKNTISILKADLPEKEQRRWLQGLEREVQRIEPKRLTGHAVLDTILGEKLQTCQLDNIQLSFVLDGKLFKDMELEDLCIIFGGALDNAIEGVRKLPEEQRLIHLKAYLQQGYLVILIENMYADPLEYRDGLPVTTKKDSFSHGYGLKGIRYALEKYGGTMKIHTQDGWFRLTLLIPEERR